MVDVVFFHGNQVVGSIKVDSPIVISIAGGGVIGHAVDFAVGDCDAVGGASTEDNVLAADERGLYAQSQLNLQ